MRVPCQLGKFVWACLCFSVKPDEQLQQYQSSLTSLSVLGFPVTSEERFLLLLLLLSFTLLYVYICLHMFAWWAPWQSGKGITRWPISVFAAWACTCFVCHLTASQGLPHWPMASFQRLGLQMSSTQGAALAYDSVFRRTIDFTFLWREERRRITTTNS